VGSGLQLSILSIGTGLVGCIVGDRYSDGVFWLCMVGVYLISTGCNGFISGYVYKFLNGKRWIKSIFISSSIFGVPCILSYLVINLILKYIGYHLALSLPQLLMVFWIWGFLTLPLSLYGGAIGRNSIASIRTDLISKQDLKLQSHPPLSIILANCILPYIAFETSIYNLSTQLTILSTSHYLYGISTMMLISILLLTMFISSVSLQFYKRNISNIWWEIFTLSG
jgi:hypothetical protein